MENKPAILNKWLTYYDVTINFYERIQREFNNRNIKLFILEQILKNLKISVFSTTKSSYYVILKRKQKEVNIHSIVKL